MGRTGKKNPRITRTFLEWVDEKTVLKVISNMYNYIEKHIDRSLPKEHVGYIVDRTGLNTFKEEVLKEIALGKKARVAEFIDFGGYFYFLVTCNKITGLPPGRPFTTYRGGCPLGGFC